MWIASSVHLSKLLHLSNLLLVVRVTGAAANVAGESTVATDVDTFALLQVQSVSQTSRGLQTGRGSATRTPGHYWPHARGPMPGQRGATDVVAPRNISSVLAWSWQHPNGRYTTVIPGGAVVDGNKNLYVATTDEIFKFNEDGDVLWQYKPPGSINNEPALMGRSLFGSTWAGYAFAVDADSGRELWQRRLSAASGPDCGYPAAFDGVFVVGGVLAIQRGAGNQVVFGLDPTTGTELWEFRPFVPVWNFMPVFPGDGSTVFMDYSGGMYRVGLHNGTLMWHAPAPNSSGSFTDGGVSVGPNEVVYSCSNTGVGQGYDTTPGAIRAFRVADGRMLWERLLPLPCNSYPAVGHVVNEQVLSVVVTPGSFPGPPTVGGSVMVLDALSGELQWMFQPPAYSGPLGMAKGDLERIQFNKGRTYAMCGPAHWSAPTIAGDGAVYATRCDGFLYIMRSPADGAGANPGVQVELFDAAGSSLHGAIAWAPGLTALATCDTLHVFKY